MRKFLSSAAGASFNQEVATQTICVREDCVELIYMKEIPGLEVYEPEGAFYVFPRCSSFFGKSYNGRLIESSFDLSMFLLEEGYVATVGGDAFGAPDYLRLSYSTSEDRIKEGLKRIKDTLALLN